MPVGVLRISALIANQPFGFVEIEVNQYTRASTACYLVARELDFKDFSSYKLIIPCQKCKKHECFKILDSDEVISDYFKEDFEEKSLMSRFLKSKNKRAQVGF